jgi:hypothetical protein
LDKSSNWKTHKNESNPHHRKRSGIDNENHDAYRKASAAQSRKEAKNRTLACSIKEHQADTWNLNSTNQTNENHLYVDHPVITRTRVVA